MRTPPLFWPKMQEGRYAGRLAANSRAKRYALLLGIGWSQGQVSREDNVGQNSVSLIMATACPPFRYPGLPP